MLLKAPRRNNTNFKLGYCIVVLFWYGLDGLIFGFIEVEAGMPLEINALFIING